MSELFLTKGPWRPLVFCGFAALTILAGCGPNGSSSATGNAGASTVVPGATTPGSGNNNQTTPGTTTPPPTFTMPANGPLTPGLEADLARAFAPQLRFNAYHNDGSSSFQNRSEDYFPQGVASYFREMESGTIQRLLIGSILSSNGISIPMPSSATIRFDNNQIKGMPKRMVGDVPGTAPTYTHLYLDPNTPALNTDGSGEMIVWAEYWYFYPQDRSEATLLTFIPTPGPIDFSGHRGDWEHTTYKVRVQLDRGLTFLDGIIEQGYYSAHGDAFLVDAVDLEFVDDSGQATPNARHPVVYVSQGKHAAYPQAGEWEDHGDFPSWLASHTDFFRGNGVVIDTWGAPLHDIGDPASNPAEFSSPEFLIIAARSPAPFNQMQNWTEYRGDWGPDDVHINIFGQRINIAGSPSGPTVKSSFGNFGGKSVPWRDAKASHSKLRIYKDRGITIPSQGSSAAPTRQ